MSLYVSPAFWIDPQGKVIELGNFGKHNDILLAEPEKFGLTTEEIKEEYKKTGEPIGSEGRARGVLISKCLDAGWTRIRKHRGFWTIQAKKVNDGIIGWAYDCLGGRIANVKAWKNDRVHLETRKEQVDISFEQLLVY